MLDMVTGHKINTSGLLTQSTMVRSIAPMLPTNTHDRLMLLTIGLGVAEIVFQLWVLL
jgi:hypothetical protein